MPATRDILNYLKKELSTLYTSDHDSKLLDTFGSILSHRPNRDANAATALFDKVMDKIQNQSASENDRNPWLIRLLVNASLLQAHELLTQHTLSALKVLNDLDRSLFISSTNCPSHALHLIHQTTEYIEEHFSNDLPTYSNNTLPSILEPATVSTDLRNPVQRISATDLDLVKFQSMIQDTTCRPFIIEDTISHWPSLSTRPWTNLHYLETLVGGHRLVPVEQGRQYTDTEWTQRLVPFGEFLRTLPSDNSQYLAQHNLFDQAPRLQHDVYLPDYAMVDTGRNMEDVEMNLWLGPKDTRSPLHFDKYDNLFAQVVGNKYFRMFEPQEASKLYPYGADTLLGNTSQVDVSKPDFVRFPKYHTVSFVDCVVRPGDLLYIPPYWWHYVRSLSISASISMWF